MVHLDVRIKLGFICLFLAISPAWSLIEIHDIRYTLVPEVLIPDQSEFSGGFQTHWVADGDMVGTLKFGINDRFELGSRLIWATENNFDNHQVLLDLGVKVALSSWQSVQADVILGINNNRGGGVVLGYASSESYTKRISAIYEGRVGFLDAAAGSDWMSFEIGAHPRFKIADPLRLRMGIALGSTLRHPIDRFQLDLFPGLEIGLSGHLHLFGEFAVGILGSNDHRLALHLVSQF